MVLTAERERVKDLLKETITILCRNGLQYKQEFSIEALIGITLDKDEVFLVSIKETIQTLAEKAHNSSEDEQSETDSSLSPKSPKNRKRKRRKRHSEQSDHGSDNEYAVHVKMPTYDIPVKTESCITGLVKPEPESDSDCELIEDSIEDNSQHGHGSGGSSQGVWQETAYDMAVSNSSSLALSTAPGPVNPQVGHFFNT